MANATTLALLQPHSDEWFEALLVYNMRMALHVLEIVAAAGDKEVCSICGDKPTKDMKIAGGPALKLCDSCIQIRKIMFDEDYVPLEPSS